MSPDTYLVSVGVLNQSPFQLWGREGTSLNWTRRERERQWGGGGTSVNWTRIRFLVLACCDLFLCDPDLFLCRLLTSVSSVLHSACSLSISESHGPAPERTQQLLAGTRPSAGLCFRHCSFAVASHHSLRVPLKDLLPRGSHGLVHQSAFMAAYDQDFSCHVSLSLTLLWGPSSSLSVQPCSYVCLETP